MCARSGGSFLKRVLLTSFATLAAFAFGPGVTADATVLAADPRLYDSTVAPLPANLPSLGFEATQTGEFGDAVTLAGTSRELGEATVTFSTWALRSQWPGWQATDGGWSWPVTLTVYPVGTGSAVGAPLGSVTEHITVPWRPEPTDGCPELYGVVGWSPAGSTSCYNGLAFNATFDLSSIGEVPDNVIVTAAYNTRGFGASPIGVTGPYDSLNVALRNTGPGANGPVPVGTDADTGTVVLDSGTGELRLESGWAPYTPAFSLTAAGGCAFSESGTTLTLLSDCTTDETIAIPAGYTLDGAGHTITAVDPDGGHFLGAVLTNAARGDDVHIADVTVAASDLSDTCDVGADRLRGILLDGVGGTISDVTVTGIRQGDMSGCQEGNAIEARNFAPNGDAASPAVRVSVTGSTVTGYQKNAITFNGGVIGTATGNTVTGDGPVGYIAQNGIQVGFGASGAVSGNIVTGNYYTGADDACGVLLYQADGVRQWKNSFAGNERNVCNYGRGGGHDPSA